MSKIITITLNPAIDKSTTIDQLQPEKKMRCTQPVFQPGGGGINVSRALHKLDTASTCMYFCGGYSGEFFNELLIQESIDILPIKIKGHTRENFIAFDQSQQKQYRFGMPGIMVDTEECSFLLSKIAELKEIDFIIVSGSMPIGAPKDLCSSIAKLAKNKSAKFILDTSGVALTDGIGVGAFLIKPNLNELQSLCGDETIAYDAIPSIGKNLMEKYQIENMIVSLGKDGAILISQHEAFHVSPPKVNAVSTVGAGDSMVAGIVHGLHHNWSMLDSAKHGIACGTATTLQPGTALFNPADINTLHAEVSVKNLY
jgi:6-phosphofructokinase 2